MLVRRFKYPATDGLIFRRTMDELRKNHLDPLFSMHPYMRDWYNQDGRTLTLPNKSRIVFGFAEHEGDIYRYRGQQYMDILVDEATHLTELMIRELGTCRRWPGVAEDQCKSWFTMNPGGVGHSYIKRVFIDRNFKSNEDSRMFFFMPAYAWDNVRWAEDALERDSLTIDAYYAWTDLERYQYFITRTQYGRELNSLPEPDRSQQLLGRWDSFEGQCFPELDDNVHNLDRYFNTDDPVQWRDFHSGFKKVGSLDHATTGITAYLMTGIDPDENLIALEEYYQADRLISEHAHAVKSLYGEYGNPEYQLIDPSTESKTMQNANEMYSVQDAYRREGIHTIPARRASIGVGIDSLRKRLRKDPNHRNPFTQEKGSPRLFISRKRCPNLWQEMTELQQVNKDGRVEYIGRDHATDDLRYIDGSRPDAPARQREDLQKLAPVDQLKVRAEQSFARRWDENVNGSVSWY